MLEVIADPRSKC